MKLVKSIFFRVILILFSFVSASSVFSQKKQGDFIIEKINGVKYYIHSVEKGNTLYSISKKYGISVEEIIKNNPEASSGLKIGQHLKIPVNKANLKNSDTLTKVMEGNFLIHEVSPKETMYSISKKYQIKVKDIMDINPETTTKDLSIGQRLKIPILKSQEVKPEDIIPAKGDSISAITPVKDTSSKAAIVLKDRYSVSMLLPLFTDLNDSLERNLKFNEKPYIYSESAPALLFYEGAMIAIDSMKKTGGNFRIDVFDTGDDSAKVAGLLRNPDITNSDLIIGPFYQYLFKDVAAFAKINETGIVCPVPQSAKILLENKFASKVPASPLVQAAELAEYLTIRLKQKKIIVFGSTEKNDMRLCQAFLDRAREKQESSGLINDYYFAEINLEKIKPLLSVTDTNYIIIPSHNQVFVSDMMTKLNSLIEKYKFVIYGLDKISEFENIDIKYFHQLNVHIASPVHIDYNSPSVINLVNKFSEKYKTEPGEFGFLGFDVTYYYLSALMKYGEHFYDYLPEYKSELFSISFDFMKTGYGSGCENKHVYILKYSDYKLVRID